MMEMVLPVANATAAALARVSAVFNAPLARAVVFGIHIDGNGHFSSSHNFWNGGNIVCQLTYMR